MNTGQQGYPVSGQPMAGYANFNTIQGLNFLPQTTNQDSLHQGGDPNSPELFKQNLQILQQNVLRLQEIAKRALDGIQNAYRSGRTPTQTEADLAALKQALQIVTDLMRQSGVGGLPLLASSDGTTQPLHPAEEQVMTQTTQAVQLLYDQLKRGQDSAAVVANLLTAIHK